MRLRSRFAGSIEAKDEVKDERSFEASDVRSDALSHETSDARSDVTSIEVSDGRSNAVSIRVSILRCFPANSEASFQGSFQRSFWLRVCRRERPLHFIQGDSASACRGGNGGGRGLEGPTGLPEGQDDARPVGGHESAQLLVYQPPL